MSDCIFCKIVKKEIPSSIILENSEIIAFRDIHPQAEVHILIVTKKHIQDICSLSDGDSKYVIAVHKASKEIANILKIQQKGFRLINNCGKGAGQSVFHLHYHLISGDKISEKII